jgi:hypothetical protein
MPPILYVPYANRHTTPLSTYGGRGSFSYADTRVYGVGAAPSIWRTRDFQINGNTGEVIWGNLYQPLLGPKTLNDPIGVLQGQKPIAGGGGGARAPGKRQYGSRALGYNPNGLVLIRLMRIE